MSVVSFQLSAVSFQFSAFSFQLSVPGRLRQKSFSSVQLQGGIQFSVLSFQLGAESVLYGTDSVRPPSDSGTPNSVKRLGAKHLSAGVPTLTSISEK